MKKLLFLVVALLVATASIQAQRIPVTVTKKGTRAVDSVTYHLNPAQIQYVQKGTSTIIGYTDIMYKNAIVNLTVTESFDTVFQMANRFKPNLIKVLVSTLVRNTVRDTLNSWLFPLDRLSDSKAVTVTNQETAKTQVYLEQAGVNKPYYINETQAELKARIDSLFQVGSDNYAIKYDTSNYTVKTYDKHIILNSTTADTLTLLNPNLFTGKSPLVVANIGSGAYTLAGGFTVKDKSGSTVSSLTANTVYTFKAYYNGSAYIWLKEY